MASEPLYLTRMQIERGPLYALGKERGIPMHTPDQGYLVNTLLRETFEGSVPRPFLIDDKRPDPRRPRLSVLSYSAQGAQALRARAEAAPEPLRRCLLLEALESKAMPADWREGERLHFQVRVCPLIRTQEEGKGHRGEREVDAFLVKSSEVGEGVPLAREEVYAAWLERELVRRGGARPIEPPGGGPAITLGKFLLGDHFRREQGGERRGHVIRQPEATLHGVLAVTDGEAFSGLLRRGIGRQLHFGFGMLLVRAGPGA